ncbi:predicted protein [Arabidopsis lyrata subsp. lyrata]|uniref:Predicted protein n=1 Tax=Arabidopsis lyrata subsp. lyrata TaxID=81972 RepID=D7LFA0_ARALL|nr:predicted protein [Arabidopsis lyrata subsp. lyrata]
MGIGFAEVDSNPNQETEFESNIFFSFSFIFLAVGDEPLLQSYDNQYRPFVIGAAMNNQNEHGRRDAIEEINGELIKDKENLAEQLDKTSSMPLRLTIYKTTCSFEKEAQE